MLYFSHFYHAIDFIQHTEHILLSVLTFFHAFFTIMQDEYANDIGNGNANNTTQQNGKFTVVVKLHKEKYRDHKYSYQTAIAKQMPYHNLLVLRQFYNLCLNNGDFFFRICLFFTLIFNYFRFSIGYKTFIGKFGIYRF